VCSPPPSLRESKPAPFQKFQQRLQSFSAPTPSIIAKSTCFNTYILSVMPYTASYFGLSTADLNYLRQQAVKFVLDRHWTEAEICPYVLRYIGFLFSLTLLCQLQLLLQAFTFAKVTDMKICGLNTVTAVDAI